jgi:CRISPR-associated endonuclease/helicase Cas3
MCAEHRTKVLDIIRKRLKASLSCLVISTQLIEAGVDIDFPVVYRAIAGIDAIAQAAGRCNREGKLKTGPVFIFELTSGLPPGMFSRLASFTRQVLQIHDNPLQLEAVEEYFNLRYMLSDDLDKHSILKKLKDGAAQNSFQFCEITEYFKFINSAMIEIIIPFDELARCLIKKIRASAYPASYARRLQRYCVTIYPCELAELQNRGYIEIISTSIFVLSCSDEQFEEAYSPNCGLNVAPQMELLLI